MGNNPVVLRQIQGGGPGAQYVGNYYQYVIKGITGSLTLGNRNNHDAYSMPFAPFQRDWRGQQSWATFGFQVNNERFTNPALSLRVNGSRAGDSSGVVTQFLFNPVILRSRGSWDRSITFVPHANPYFLQNGSGISNKTPSGRLVVLADLYKKAPVPKGTLDVSQVFVFPSSSVVVSFDYDRGKDALLEGSHSLGGNTPFGVQ